MEVEDALDGGLVTIGGMAKGSGMIHPNMATMLAYLTTDAAITSVALQAALQQAVDNRLIALPWTAIPAPTIRSYAWPMAWPATVIRQGTGLSSVRGARHEACQPLALAICRDGEGVTKVVRIEVTGADSGSARQWRKPSRHPVWSKQHCSVKTPTGDGSWPPSGAQESRSTKRVASRLKVSLWCDAGKASDSAAERRIAKVFQRKSSRFPWGSATDPTVTHVDHRLILRIRADQRELSLVGDFLVGLESTVGLC